MAFGTCRVQILGPRSSSLYSEGMKLQQKHQTVGVDLLGQIIDEARVLPFSGLSRDQDSLGNHKDYNISMGRPYQWSS